MRFLLITVLLMPALCACDRIPGWTRAETGQSLLVAGSSTMLPLAENMVEAFLRDRRNVSAVCSGGGSSAGIVALRRGAIDVALLSRDVRGQEDAQGLRCLPYARNAVALVTHPSNPLSDLSVERMRAILVGDVDNWAAVGGKDGNIRVISRKAGSTTLQSINDLILHGDDITDAATLAASSGELLNLVAADPHAVGFVSYADWSHAPADMPTRIKMLTVNQVRMQRETILSGRYPLTRVLYFAMLEEQTPVARAFLDFALGPQGRKITAEMGLLPLR